MPLPARYPACSTMIVSYGGLWRWAMAREAQGADEAARLCSFVLRCYPDGAITQMTAQRESAGTTVLTVYTSVPGVVLGTDRMKVEEVQRALARKSGQAVRIEVLDTTLGQGEDDDRSFIIAPLTPSITMVSPMLPDPDRRPGHRCER